MIGIPLPSQSSLPESPPADGARSVLFLPPGRPRPLARRLAIHNRVVHRIRRFLHERRFVEVPPSALLPAGDLQLGPSGLAGLDALAARGFPAVWCEFESRRPQVGDRERTLPGFKLIEAVRCGTDLPGLCLLMEDLLKAVAADLSADLLGGRQVTLLDRVVTLRHPRLDYAEALSVLAGRGWNLAYGQDLPFGAEQALIRHCGNLPVLLTDPPRALKPQLAPAVATAGAAAGVRYLLPYAGEAMDGGVRAGEPQRAGFGLGVARLLQFLMGLGSIRDAVVPPPAAPAAARAAGRE